VSLNDRRIYGAILKLLHHGADVTPKLISEVSGVNIHTIYYKIRNYYIYENQTKRGSNGKKV